MAIQVNMSHKTIHARLWSPLNALFKSHRNDPATCEIYFCEMADTCPLLKKRQCINKRIMGPKCPHGHCRTMTGPTKRSSKLTSWLKDREKEFAGMFATLSSPPDKVVEIGDWVYLPYSHMDMNKAVPFNQHSCLFVSGSPFIKKEIFTVELIKCIVDFHPYALMGGEITTYQEEVVPKFLVHLEEVYPFLYTTLVQANPHYIAKYSLQNKNYVGRTALLRTVAPCVLEIGKNKWKWDGQQLASLSFDTLWIDVLDENRIKAIDSINVTITPSEKAVVKITNNEQVTPTTVLID
jgi:hypothetical protein